MGLLLLSTLMFVASAAAAAPGCPPVFCRIYCEYGFQLDAGTGCPVCSCNTEPHTPCQQALADALGHGRVGAFTPSCDQDGSYSAMQCWASTGYCWCVSKQGKSISERSRTLRSCDCIRHKYEQTSQMLIGSFTPRCESNGYYSPLQCHASTGLCWCSDQDGKQLTTPQHGQPNC